MTWRELFARLWLFLRAHLRRQHMCPECGDVMTHVFLPWDGKGWQCETCEEYKHIDAVEKARQQIERNNAKLGPRQQQYAMQRITPGRPIYIHEFHDIMKQVYEPLCVPPLPELPLSLTDYDDVA